MPAVQLRIKFSLSLSLSRISGRRAACAAGRLDGAYWLIGPGSTGLAQGCRCTLPLQAWAGHIVAAARLQLVWFLNAFLLRHRTLRLLFNWTIFQKLLQVRPGPTHRSSTGEPLWIAGANFPARCQLPPVTQTTYQITEAI